MAIAQTCLRRAAFSAAACLAASLVGVSPAGAPAGKAAPSPGRTPAQKEHRVEYLHLRAGPIRCKFQDGELRYLRVGRKEIVRRVYFAVRDRRWDTVMPRFSRAEVRKGDRAFEIRLEADCRNDVAGYRWTGRIVGTAEGKITFTVQGETTRDFKSPRVGFCVLYGAESLAGQAYETTEPTGKTVRSTFPEDVSYDLLRAPGSYQQLDYSTEAGLRVSTRMVSSTFGMEDQRNYGDSSYKAFHSMSYEYPQLAKGAAAAATLVVEVRDVPEGAAKAAPDPAEPTVVRWGERIEGARLPRLAMAEKLGKPRGFRTYARDPKKLADADRIHLSYTPAMHMPDDDTFMENPPAIRDQVRTLRQWAPEATFCVAPITLASPYPRPGPDPRCSQPFAAAWAIRTAKYLALGGVDEAGFSIGRVAEAALDRLGAHAGQPLHATGVAPHAPVDALAVDAGAARLLWLINTTDAPRPVRVEGLGPAGDMHSTRLNPPADAAEPGPAAPKADEPADAKDGALEIVLGPYEVRELSVPARR